jgi:hypothetical protein
MLAVLSVQVVDSTRKGRQAVLPFRQKRTDAPATALRVNVKDAGVDRGGWDPRGRDRGRFQKASTRAAASEEVIVLVLDANVLIRAVLGSIDRRDTDDWPVLAVALALDCPIWTEDTDFFGCGVAIWTMDRVELYLATASEREM